MIPAKTLEDFDKIVYQMVERTPAQRTWTDKEVIELEKKAMSIGLQMGYKNGLKAVKTKSTI